MREFADKSDGVRQKYLLMSVKFQHPRSRIKRCKKLILLQHLCIGQMVEQRGFAGIRVSDDCNNRHIILLTLGACDITVLDHLLQFTVELRDTIIDQSAVNL